MKAIIIKQSHFDDTFDRHVAALNSWLRGKSGVTEAVREHAERIMLRIKRDLENEPRD